LVEEGLGRQRRVQRLEGLYCLRMMGAGLDLLEVEEQLVKLE
jgi:hypothetical protein